MNSEAGGVVTGDDGQGRGLVPKLRFPEFWDAGVWEAKSLAKLCEINPASPLLPKSFEYIDLASVEAGKLTAANHVERVGAPSRAQRLLQSGDILFQMVRPYQRNNLLFESESGHFVASTGYAQLRANESIQFLYQIIHIDDFVERVIAKCTGSNYPAINSSDLAGIALATPKPAEQQKIADCLSSLDAVIAAEGKRLAALKAHKKALMQQLFPAEGQTTPRLRFPEFQGAGEWRVQTLGKVCEVLQGYGFPEAMQGKEKGDYPFCKVSDISRAVSGNGGALNAAVNYVDQSDLKNLRAKTVPPGSIVFAKIGEALRLNRRAMSTVECIIDNNAVALKPKIGATISHFLFLLSQKIDMNEYCAGAVPSVNKSTLDAIRVLVPSVPEQQRLAETFSSVDATVAAQSDRIGVLKRHKSGLMQQLFPSPHEATT